MEIGHYIKEGLMSLGGYIMLQWFNPWWWVKSLVKKELKLAVQTYGDKLEDQVIDLIKSQKTEENIRACFDKEQELIIQKIDLL